MSDCIFIELIKQVEKIRSNAKLYLSYDAEIILRAGCWSENVKVFGCHFKVLPKFVGICHILRR